MMNPRCILHSSKIRQGSDGKSRRQLASTGTSAMVVALAVLAAAFAATASADHIVRGEPIIRSCSGTGDECSIDVA
jgi:hypothetical protein